LTKAALRVTALSKQKAAVYLRRARNLLAAATLAEDRKNWDGVAVASVQATISFADAFTVRTLGLRSHGQDHGEVVPLISRVSTEAASELARCVQTVLNRKNDVEYGAREVSANDARQILRVARKIEAIVEAT
jgi:HEPN domain-containing protein